MDGANEFIALMMVFLSRWAEQEKKKIVSLEDFVVFKFQVSSLKNLYYLLSGNSPCSSQSIKNIDRHATWHKYIKHNS